MSCAAGEPADLTPDARDRASQQDAAERVDAADPDAAIDDFCSRGGSDGRECGSGDACHDAPVCVRGICTPRPLADGTVCALAPTACQQAGTCSAGVCGAVSDAPDGTVCSPAANACHTDGVCQRGACGAQGVRPNGYNYAPGDLNRCCGGVPSQMNSPQHCGVCGINCGGTACVNAGGAWQCSCTTSSQCWSGCCATSAGPPYVCSPSTCGNPAYCIACPGGGVCTMAQPHYYCHY